jgi:hypothetical protein
MERPAPATDRELGPQRGVFRASLRVAWGFSGMLALILAPLVIARIVRMEPIRGSAVAAALGALLLIPILVFAAIAPFAWLYRIRVHEAGLRGYDAYGRFHSVRWSSMTAARPMALLTLEYLRVETSSVGVELVIPLFLSERARFERMIREVAGPLNPMSRHFEAPVV